MKRNTCVDGRSLADSIMPRHNGIGIVNVIETIEEIIDWTNNKVGDGDNRCNAVDIDGLVTGRGSTFTRFVCTAQQEPSCPWSTSCWLFWVQ